MKRRTEHNTHAPPRGWTRREFLVRTLLSSVSAGSAGALANLLFVSRVMASERRFSDYRALVNIYLGGGNDSLNMVFPRDASYAAYADTRQTMAWAQGSGRAITPATAQFFEPALAPALGQTASLFADGDLAILANVGVLTGPTTRAQLLADPRLLPILQTMVEYVRSLNPDAPGVPSMLDVTTEMKKWEQALLRQGRRKGLKEGLEKGLEKGLSPLQRQFARRLGRPLSAAEQRILVARLDTLGPDRLGDVVLDVTPDALREWLSALDAR